MGITLVLISSECSRIHLDHTREALSTMLAVTTDTSITPTITQGLPTNGRTRNINSLEAKGPKGNKGNIFSVLGFLG